MKKFNININYTFKRDSLKFVYYNERWNKLKIKFII